MPCRKSQWVLQGSGIWEWLTAPHRGSRRLSQPSSSYPGLYLTWAHLAVGYQTRDSGQADLPLPHTCPATSRYRHVQACTVTFHVRSPVHTRALSPHVTPCTCMCSVILIVAAPPCLCTRPASLLPQGHRPVVRGQRRLGDEAAALAAPEPAPLQRALRPPQGLVPEGSGAPQPGGAVLPGHRVSKTMQDAQGGLHRGSRGDGRLRPGARSAVLTTSLPFRLWIHWPEAGHSATRTRWTGPMPLTHH